MLLMIGVVLLVAVLMVGVSQITLRDTTARDKMIRIRVRDYDEQWVALIIPALKKERTRRIFRKDEYVYQASYDRKKWVNISVTDYRVFRSLRYLGEEYWRPISEEEAEKLMAEIEEIEDSHIEL